MGYRHTMTSDTLVPSIDKLPKWFVDKYKDAIDFDRAFWCSRNEYKRYGLLGEFEEDVVKILADKEVDTVFGSIRLIYFADESDEEYPDIVHVNCTAKGVATTYMVPGDRGVI